MLKLIFFGLTVFFGIKTLFEAIAMMILLYQGKPSKPTYTPLFFTICLSILYHL